MTFELARLLAEASVAATIEDVSALVLRDAEAINALPTDECERANERIADAIREWRECRND